MKTGPDADPYYEIGDPFYSDVALTGNLALPRRLRGRHREPPGGEEAALVAEGTLF